MWFLWCFYYGFGSSFCVHNGVVHIDWQHTCMFMCLKTFFVKLVYKYLWLAALPRCLRLCWKLKLCSVAHGCMFWITYSTACCMQQILRAICFLCFVIVLLMHRQKKWDKEVLRLKSIAIYRYRCFMPTTLVWIKHV